MDVGLRGGGALCLGENKLKPSEEGSGLSIGLYFVFVVRDVVKDV